MILSEYINEIGVGKFSKMLGVTRQTLEQWRSLTTAPSPENAFRIVEITLGVVSWEDIYKPVAIDRLRYSDPKQLELGLYIDPKLKKLKKKRSKGK